jgi:prepilin-type N-terminal cleavage/methylation domain-containing protein/prepilin-type processing-associated H-X9-DG protein
MISQKKYIIRKKGFTLIELLVVIAIVALLISIIIPALKKSKNLAQRLICSNHLRNIGLANVLYADDHDGWYVPVLYRLEGSIAYYEWPLNNTFRNLLGYVAAESTYDQWGNKQWHAPKKFLCPSDEVAKDKMEDTYYTNWISYAGNITDWTQNWNEIMYAGHRNTNVRNPSGELSFSESNDWWMWWSGADYRAGWDELGHDTITPYQVADCSGPTLYRHSEGANLLFYDGHVQWRPKERIFIIENWEVARPGIWSIYSEYPPPLDRLDSP